MTEILPEQGWRQIKAHNGHPGEHGDGGEVTKESDDCAEKFVKVTGSIVNSEEEDRDKCDADYIAQDYPPG